MLVAEPNAEEIATRQMKKIATADLRTVTMHSSGEESHTRFRRASSRPEPQASLAFDNEGNGYLRPVSLVHRANSQMDDDLAEKTITTMESTKNSAPSPVRMSLRNFLT